MKQKVTIEIEIPENHDFVRVGACTKGELVVDHDGSVGVASCNIPAGMLVVKLFLELIKGAPYKVSDSHRDAYELIEFKYANKGTNYDLNGNSWDNWEEIPFYDYDKSAKDIP